MNSKSLMDSVINAETRQDTCETHGSFGSTFVTLGGVNRWTGCPKCAEEQADRRRAAELDEWRQEAAKRRMEKLVGYACLPPRFANKTFDTYRADSEQQRKYLDKCQAYAKNFPAHLEAGEGLMLLGNPGTGKTHLAAATLSDILSRHQMPGLYTTAARMFRRIKDTYGRSEESESQAIEAFTKPSLLVLDEIGVSFGSDAELNYLFDIMNERYEQCMPTIVVSNVQPAELGQWMGERVVDRLRECSKLMVFDWESARREIGKGVNHA